MEIALRDYQKESVDTFFNKLSSGVKRQLIVLPTGAGKTIISSAISKRFHYEVDNSRPIVFIAHREELLKQTAIKMNLVWEGVKIGRVKGIENEQEGDVIVASTQTLVRGRELVVQPSLVIYDEAHHSASKGSRRILSELGCFRLDGPPLLGITATPNRADKLELGSIFEEIVYEKSILDLIIARYLCDIKAKKIVAQSLDLDNVQTIAGDFNQKELGEAMTQDAVIEDVIGAYLEHGEGRKTIIFAASVKQTYEIADRLKERGILAAGIDGSLDINVRDHILKEFEQGHFTVLVNCMVLTEGFDEPSVSCIMMARPTKSESLYVQCVGRGLRLHPDKKDCLVLDIVGVTENNSLMTLPKLFPVNPNDTGTENSLQDMELADGESVLEFQQRVNKVRMEHGKKMMEISLFTTNSIFRWISIADHAYYIGMGGNRACYLVKDGENGWWVLFEHSDKKIFPLYHEPITLEYAQGVAENFLNTVQNPLMTKEARWRQFPISEGQKEQLRKYNVNFEENWTKGQASDVLDQVFGNRNAKNVIKRFDPEFYRTAMMNPHVRNRVSSELLRIQKEIARI